jgi:hypothetical protein
LGLQFCCLGWEGEVSVHALGFRLPLLCTAIGAALVIAAWGTPASAANWFEKTFYLIGPRYDAVLPPCDASSALANIQSRFARKEGRFWNSDLRIVEFDSVRETALRPWAEGTLPRRFCSARALVSDGRWRPIYYSIVEEGGMISAGWGVQWCVVGLDRNWAHNPNCKMARP